MSAFPIAEEETSNTTINLEGVDNALSFPGKNILTAASQTNLGNAQLAFKSSEELRKEISPLPQKLFLLILAHINVLANQQFLQRVIAESQVSFGQKMRSSDRQTLLNGRWKTRNDACYYSAWLFEPESSTTASGA